MTATLTQQAIDLESMEVRTVSEVPAAYRIEPTGWDRFFWQSTENLRRIYQWALAHMLAPYVVLMNVLARLLVSTPPNVVLPSLVGSSPASLNLNICVVGYSGQGKDQGINAATTLIPDVRDAVTSSLASGEGVAALHAVRVPEINPESGKPVPGSLHNEPNHIRAILRCSEAATLKALIGRSENTLIGTLNNAWSGLQLGGAVKAQENNLSVPAHGYREVLVIATQPAYVGMLSAQHDNGFLQRLIWASAYDPRINDVPTDAVVNDAVECPEGLMFDPATIPAAPEPSAYENLYLAGSRERLMNPGCYPLHEMTFPKTARRQVVEFRKDHNQPGINQDDPDAHRLLLQMKLAAALHFLDHDHNGRPCDLKVGQREWNNAGHLMAYSIAVRAKAERQGREARQYNDAEQIADRNEANDLAEAKVLEKAKTRILKVLADRDPGREGMTERDLRNNMNTTQRKVFSLAIEALKNAGGIDWVERGEGGMYYSLPM